MYKQLEIFKNNQVIHQQYALINNFFNYDIGVVSHQNLRRIRKMITDGLDSILSLVVNPNDKNFFSQFPLAKFLTEFEKAIFHYMITHCSLKHATSSFDAIQQSGKLISVRNLEQTGKFNNHRHTTAKSGVDRSVYFVYGIGKHKTPEFLTDATHIITVDLDAMQRNDALTTKRLWVSGHLNEYEKQRLHRVKMGNVLFTVQHHRKNYTKTYQFIYPNGQTLKWKIKYHEEVFAGYDVTPGIALQFIFMLRLLSREKNPLMEQFYHTNPQSVEFETLLQQLFSVISPGWIYPEAKIIAELDISKSYVQVELKSRESHLDIKKYFNVVDAVEKGDVLLLQAFFKKDYPFYLDGSKNLIDQAFCNDDPDSRQQILRFLIRQGIYAAEHRDGDTPLHTAAEKGTAEDLELLLGSEYPLANQALIRRIPPANIRCRPFGLDFDLIEIACKYDFTGKKLEVLKKYGADFKKNGVIYIKAAINAKLRDKYGYISGNNVNMKALQFLQQEGVSPDDDELWNETPLMLASSSAYLAIAEFLIDKMSANVNAQLRFGVTSALTGKTYFADPSNGMTALHFAAKNNHDEMVSFLLYKGADANLQTVCGKKPLDFVKNNEGLKSLLMTHTKQTKELTLSCTTNTRAERETKAKQQKVAILLTGTKNSKRYVVLGKRRTKNKSMANYYCFPGGSSDVDDSTLVAAALRELFEETNVDVNKIPQAKITQLISIDGFHRTEHESTTFVMVDVGNYALSIYPSDDLIEVKRILIDRIKINHDKPTAKYMQVDDMLVLGSNALLIESILLQQKNILLTSLTNERIELIRKQLFIEEQGLQLLLDLIDKETNENISIHSPAWKELINLLENNAHLSKKDNSYRSLPMVMLTANCLEGITLLAQYGINLNKPSEVRVNGKVKWLTPLAYAVFTNQVAAIKHLLSLGAQFNDEQINQSMLVEVAEQGNSEMFAFLLEQGLDPNKSYDYRPFGGSTLIHPIISRTLKADHLAMMRLLLQEKRIYLNRERSALNRNTALMTAIDHDKKEAALYLLASFRLDLTAQNKPYNGWGKNNQTALDLANLKKDWQDVIKISQFLLVYSDMNNFLEKNQLPTMERFELTKCSDGKATVHCYRRDFVEIKKLAKAAFYHCQIHKDNDYYYIRLGIEKLSKLLLSRDIAHFLLNYTDQKAIFWNVRIDKFRVLQKELIANTKKSLHPKDFLNIEKKFDLENEAYYEQLVRENISVQQVAIPIPFKNEWSFYWLLAAIKNHDKIQEIYLDFKTSDKLQVEKFSQFQAVISTVMTLKNLKKIICESIPESLLFHLLERLNERNVELYPEIIIQEYGAYSNKYNATILQHQINFYAKKDPNFLGEIEKMKNSVQESLTLDGLYCKTTLLQKLAMLYTKPKKLIIRDSFPNYDVIYDFLQNNKTVEFIYIEDSVGLEKRIKLFNKINSAHFELKALDLSFYHLRTSGIIQLAETLRKHPITHLDISNAKINSIDEEAMAKLSEAIGYSSLVVLNIKDLHFPTEGMRLQFFLHISSCTSLLSIQHDKFVMPSDIKSVLTRNIIQAANQKLLTPIKESKVSMDAHIKFNIFKHPKITKVADENDNNNNFQIS